MTDDVNERRRQAIGRAARALTQAIVDLAQAVSMPREDPQPVIAQTPRDPRDVLTLKQVCEISGLARSTFYNMRLNGDGPPLFVVRNRLRCYRSDLEAWMNERGNR